MTYYVGESFDKEKCKQYKTESGAIKAAEKDSALMIWNENGEVVELEVSTPETPESSTPETPESSTPETSESSTPETPESSTPETPEGSTPETPESSTPETPESSTPETPEGSTPEAPENSTPENKVIVPCGKMRVTVICDGSLNIRRSPDWGDNICGRATKGQTYYVKEIHVVDGKRMVRTIGDLYISGDTAHVQYEQT